MKKYLVHALFIGIFGTLLIFLLVYVLKLRIIHPLVVPVLLIFAVALSTTLITFKLSAGLSARMVTFHILQTTVLSTVITNLPMLASAGYLWFLRTQQPGQINIQTAHINYYRDAPEVALDVFVFLIRVGFVLSVILSFAAGYFTNRRLVSNLLDKTA